MNSTPKKTFGTLLLRLLGICLTMVPFHASFADEKPPVEPTDLVSLRISWTEAKEKESKQVRDKYLDALVRLRESFTKKGELEAAVVVRAEIERLSQGKQPRGNENEGRNTPPPLIRLRSTYVREISKIAAAADKKYLGALQNLRWKYSEKGHLDDALAVEAEIKKLASEEERPAAKSTKWTWANDGGELTLFDDGTATHSRRKKSPGKWKRLADGKVFLTLGDIDYTIVFRDDGIGNVTHLASGNKTTVIPKDRK